VGYIAGGQTPLCPAPADRPRSVPLLNWSMVCGQGLRTGFAYGVCVRSGKPWKSFFTPLIFNERAKVRFQRYRATNSRWGCGLGYCRQSSPCQSAHRPVVTQLLPTRRLSRQNISQLNDLDRFSQVVTQLPVTGNWVTTWFPASWTPYQSRERYWAWLQPVAYFRSRARYRSRGW